MRSVKFSPGTVLGGLALFVALGGTALAATGQLVNIADGNDATKVAHVDAAGKLNVGDGTGPMTVDGTVTSQQAPATAFWRSAGAISGGSSGCTTIATPPAGKAIILKTLTLNVYGAPS